MRILILRLKLAWRALIAPRDVVEGSVEQTVIYEPEQNYWYLVAKPKKPEVPTPRPGQQFADCYTG